MFSGIYPFFGSFLSILTLKSWIPSPVCQVKYTPERAHRPSWPSHNKYNCLSSTVHSRGFGSLARAYFSFEKIIFKYAYGELPDFTVRCAFSHLLHALRKFPASVEWYSSTERSLLHFLQVFLAIVFQNYFYSKSISQPLTRWLPSCPKPRHLPPIRELEPCTWINVLEPCLYLGFLLLAYARLLSLLAYARSLRIDAPSIRVKQKEGL